MPPPKARYIGLDMQRWARWWGVHFRMASRFPMRTVTALRLILLAQRAGDPLVEIRMRDRVATGPRTRLLEQQEPPGLRRGGGEILAELLGEH